MKISRSLVLLFCLVSTAGLAAGSDLSVGAHFPTLKFPSLESGAPTSLEDFRGRKLALHVWASW